MLNFDAFLDSLQYMGKGMLGIFVVTAVIIGCTMLLNRLTQKKDSDKKDE